VTVDTTAVPGHVRPHVGGKIIYLGDQTLCVRGVTDGIFHPAAEGIEYHDPERVARDCVQMAANGLNAIRTYVVPPCWLLDAARRYDRRDWRASTDA
jgi:O-antigen biosynthesis protein